MTNKNNPYDDLNYTPARRTAVDDFSAWYKANGKTIEPETRSEIDMLRELHASGHELSPMQKMMLGFAELTKKNEADSLERQKSSYDQRQEFEKNQEMISTQSAEFKTLQENMAKVQAEIARLSGGDGE